MVMGIAGSKTPSVFATHERLLEAPPERIGELLDRLGSADDVLWPSEHWAALRLDKPLGLGARGGHGPFRYHVVEQEPGSVVRFRLTAPPEFVGQHEFLVERAGPDQARLRHVLVMQPVGGGALKWPLLYAPLHAALIEELMDRAEAAVTGAPAPAPRWSPRVRFLRWLSRRWRLGMTA